MPPKRVRTQSDSPKRRRLATVPHFQARDVKFWFYQLEAMFRTNGIDDDQDKFDTVITAIDLNVASDISDLLEEPPEEDKYEFLKEKLIERLAVSEAARIKRILSNEQIGDRTPSQHYRHLVSTAGQNFSDAALRSIWLNSLPVEVRTVVAGLDHLTPDQQAQTADRVMEVAGRRQVAQVDTNKSAPDSAVAKLEKQISALTKKVDKFIGRAASQIDGAETPTKSRSASPAKKSKSTPGLCWYHAKFGAKAKKCSAPCSWTGEKPASSATSGNANVQQ